MREEVEFLKTIAMFVLLVLLWAEWYLEQRAKKQYREALARNTMQSLASSLQELQEEHHVTISNNICNEIDPLLTASSSIEVV
jgi:hypothetical protein